MKILMTADAVGGVWTYVLELAGALAEHGVEVVLATMGPRPDAAQQETARSIPGLELEMSGYRLEWMHDPWGDVDQAGEWLRNLAARRDVDVIHLNGYSHAALSWERPVLVCAHSCVRTWWHAVHGCEPPAEWNVYRERVASGLAGADCVIAPTRAHLAALLSCYRVSVPLHVIPNARSLKFHARHGVAGERLPSERLPIILACGRYWDQAKGLSVLDEAALGLPWHTYVAGPLEAPQGCRKQATGVRCLGALAPTDLADWFARAELFVHPVRYEPFGYAPLEAGLSGCALVLADLPSLREIWEDAALFVNARDAGAIREGLLSLIGDRQRRRMLSDASRRRARRYAPAYMGRAYLQVYKDLIGRTRGMQSRKSVPERAYA